MANIIEEVPNDLSLLKEIYEKCNLKVSEVIQEKESAEYSAYDLKINSLTVKFRTSKITPTKTGQFVTLWKRIENGPIAPFNSSDKIDFVIVSCRDNENFEQFIFPKSELIKKGIFTDKKEGKRAIRVYPSWNIEINKQAKNTQEWQLKYFLNLKNKVDCDLIKSLFEV